MIKLCVPDVGEEEVQAIREVIESKYLVQGSKVLEFEQMVGKYLNVKNVIAVSSGTAALHLSLLALDIKRGDEVIVPDFTFPATANVVEAVGATTKFVDIDINSFCIDTKKIEEMITAKTKAIIPVQEFGQSSDMDEIIDLANRYNLKIIEDAACALGAEYKNRKVGTIGDIGCFSLHPRKAITTGEGGVIVTDNDELASKIRSLRNHGISYDSGKAEFILPGLNYRMTDIQGAMAIVQMKKLNSINAKRREIAKQYNELLKDINNIRLPEEKPYGKHIWQTYHILLDEKIDRDKIIMRLRERGVETNIGAYAVHVQKYYKKKHNDNEFRNSMYSYKCGLALPLYDRITSEEVRLVVKELEKLLNE